MATPSEAELMLFMSTLIKESIIESIELGTEEQAQNLISDMVDGLIDTLGVEFLAWAPNTGKALMALEIIHPTDFFE